jgi:hypothetical protein
MHPATKSVVPVILAGSSEHVDPDVVLAKKEKKRKKKGNRKKWNKTMQVAALIPEEILHVHDVEERGNTWQVCGVCARCLQPSQNIPDGM